MVFWIAAMAAAVATAIWIARPLASGAWTARPRAAFDEQVFRDQLAEIDRDLDRGVMTAAEAEGARIEISRRLLGAAAERERAADHAPGPKALSRALAGLLLVGAPLVGAALYADLGAPGLRDMPAATRAENRPSQDYAESAIVPPPPADGADTAELAQLVAELETRLDGDAPDPRGLFLLARSQSQLGRFGDSWRSWRRLVEASDGDAPAAVFAAMGESMVLAAQGYVSPEAEAAFDAALARAPDNPIARYYLGSAYAQTARADAAMTMWSALLAASPADAPWVDSTRAQMAELAEFTGRPAPQVATLPPARDPREALLEATGALAARLEAEGGSGPQWAQLARSWRMLGMTTEAEAAEAAARAALTGEPLAAFEQALAAADAPGPDAAAVAAARDMPQDDRAAMILGMVEQLDQRLFAQGGVADDWARLINALGVLGRTDRATEAYRRAIAAHGSDPVSRAFLTEQAMLAGVRIE
jgi:cytochrome c-type biogenesis protein CcmH